MPKILEHDLQRALCIFLDGNKHKDGTWNKLPALAPGVVYWHTPNGGDRDGFEAKRFKEIGVKAGLHDLFFLRPTQFECGVFGLLFGVELKKLDGRLSKAQKEMHPRLTGAGMAASIVADTLKDAQDFLYKHSLTIRNY